MYPDSTTKRCTKCGEEKPRSEFSPDKRHRDGRMSQCRNCHNARKRELRANNPEQRAHELAYALRYQAQHRETVRQTEREYRRKRRQDSDYRLNRSRRENARTKQRRATDPIYLEKERARSRENARRYYADPKHAQKSREYRRNRYYTHNAYRAKVLKRAVIAAHTRRVRMQANGGSFTLEEWNTLCAKYNHRCLCCNRQAPLTIDHIIPISQGGNNYINNVQPLCETCNKSKGNKTIDYRTSHTQSAD